MKTVEYLDIKLSLINETVELYRKKNNELRYINVKTNHTREIINKIPTGISIGFLASKKRIFDKIKHMYQLVLQAVSHIKKIIYQDANAVTINKM